MVNKIIYGRAPLRLGLAGGGTDLNEVFEKYGGNVINAAIDKYIHASVERDVVTSLNGTEVDDFTKLIFERVATGNVKINSWREVPFGRGLGSSSSYSVLLTKLISELEENKLSNEDLVHCVYGIESQLGKCGWQDQYAAINGGFNWMDFGKEKTIYPLRIENSVKQNLEERLCLVYTGITHNSGMIQSSKPKMTEKQATKLKELAYKTRNLFLSNNIDGFENILNEGWNIKKNSSTTTKEVDDLYKFGLKNRALGGKVCGAGKGGYILFYIQPENMPNFRKQMSKNHEILDFKFTDNGVETWTDNINKNQYKLKNIMTSREKYHLNQKK